MTAHGPAAIGVVGAAFRAAGIDAPGGDVLANITGHALDVIDDAPAREAAIDALVYRWGGRPRLTRPYLTRLLDTAVEALTAAQE